MIRRLPALSAFVFLCSLQAGAQRPTAYVQGIVVAAESNAPLAKVQVELLDANGDAVLRTTRTDDDGYFFFPGTPVGEYRFLATRLGYVTAKYGQRSPGGPSLSLGVGADEVVNVPIYMARAGVITGRVIDSGRGVGLADVAAMKTVYSDGQLQTEMVISDRTNDRGEFHLYWLPPGEYQIVAVVWDTASGLANYSTPDGDNSRSFYSERRGVRAVLNRATGSGLTGNQAHIPVYYPGTTDPLGATPVRIVPGGEVHGINIDASPRPTYRVAGRVNGIGAPPAGPQPVSPVISVQGGVLITGSSNATRVRLYPLAGTLQTNAAQGGQVEVLPDGSFEFPSVVPGPYTLVATSGNRSARARIEVRSSDVLSANVTLGEGYPVVGQVVVEGALEQRVQVLLREEPPVTTATYPAIVGEDGTFSIPQNETAAAPPPGEYRVLVNPILMPPSLGTALTLPPELERAYVKSITQGNLDVLGQGLRLTGPSREPLVVVIGTNPGAVEGQVVDTGGNPATAVWVALLPTNGLRFRVNHRAVPTDSEGRFAFSNVGPGDYQVYAWDLVAEDAWQDLGFMRNYESLGTRVRVEEGALSTVDVTSIPPGY